MMSDYIKFNEEKEITPHCTKYYMTLEDHPGLIVMFEIDHPDNDKQERYHIYYRYEDIAMPWQLYAVRVKLLQARRLAEDLLYKYCIMGEMID
jgi:hypothetical protein